MSYLTTEKKQEIFAEYGGSPTNTGSVQGQIALFTHRINHLTGHLKQNKKDHGTKRSLLMLVGKRRRFLNYLAKKDIQAYRDLIAKLGIRR
jgi:small subunit ribosomal protein S15